MSFLFASSHVVHVCLTGENSCMPHWGKLMYASLGKTHVCLTGENSCMPQLGKLLYVSQGKAYTIANVQRLGQHLRTCEQLTLRWSRSPRHAATEQLLLLPHVSRSKTRRRTTVLPQTSIRRVSFWRPDGAFLVRILTRPTQHGGC